MENDVTTLRVHTKEGTAGLAFKKETKGHLATRSREGWGLVSTHLQVGSDRIDVVMFWTKP